MALSINDHVRKEVLDRALKFKYIDIPEMVKVHKGIFTNQIMKDIDNILRSDTTLTHLYNNTDYLSIVSYELVNHIILYYQESDDKFKNIINDFLDQLTIVKSYTAIICLYGLKNLPIGLKLGNLEIYSPNFENEILKRDLDTLYKSYTNYIQQQTDFLDTFSWAKVTFNDYHYWNIRDILFKELELPYAILSLLMKYGLDVRNTIGLVYYLDNPIAYLFPLKYLEEWQHPIKASERIWHSIYKEEFMEKPLNSLSNITQKSELTELEERIIRAIRLFGISRLTYRPEIKLLLVVFACETLLLNNTDVDHKKQRLSKKARKLLERDSNSEDIYVEMRDAYTIRSKIVHSGKIDDIVYKSDSLDDIFYKLICKILDIKLAYELSEPKICSDDEWLESYIGVIIIE